MKHMFLWSLFDLHNLMRICVRIISKRFNIIFMTITNNYWKSLRLICVPTNRFIFILKKIHVRTSSSHGLEQGFANLPSYWFLTFALSPSYDSLILPTHVSFYIVYLNIFTMKKIIIIIDGKNWYSGSKKHKLARFCGRITTNSKCKLVPSIMYTHCPDVYQCIFDRIILALYWTTGEWVICGCDPLFFTSNQLQFISNLYHNSLPLTFILLQNYQ